MITNQELLNLSTARKRFIQAERDYTWNAKRATKARVMIQKHFNPEVRWQSENYCYWRDELALCQREMAEAHREAVAMVKYAKPLFARLIAMRRIQAGWMYRFARRDAGAWVRV